MLPVNPKTHRFTYFHEATVLTLCKVVKFKPELPQFITSFFIPGSKTYLIHESSNHRLLDYLHGLLSCISDFLCSSFFSFVFFFVMF